MKKKLILPFVLLLVLGSCISEYIPTSISEHNELMVVDGTITDSVTLIRLSRSYAIDQNFANNIPITDARIRIEVDGGANRTLVTQPDRGLYAIATGTLHPDSAYRVYIQWNNEEYVSEYLTPLQTPAIESITFDKTGQGKPLEIFVNSTRNDSGSQFYRWTYHDQWEFDAELYAMGIWDPTGDSVKIYDEREGIYNLTFHCWQQSRSTSLILENTLQLSENHVRNKRILEIPASNKRISKLYHIEVTQYSIRKESFEYFNNLQKNIDEMGSLFAPIPSEMNGNIRNIGNDGWAIGYVDVSVPRRKKLFITTQEAGYEPTGRSCDVLDYSKAGYGIYQLDNAGGVTSWAPVECIDCTRNGGTKNKPDFWPNDHR